MKRIGYLYEEVVSFENCRDAILEASKGKKKRGYVQAVLADLDFYARRLSRMMQSGKFLSPYTPKTIVDKSSQKKREILIPRFFPDQCAHHAIVRIINPYILKSSHYWSCANIRRRGIRRAVIGTMRATRKTKRKLYCLKLDIAKYYPSIDHDILKEQLRRKFKDEKLLSLIDKVIDSCAVGVPIGNYTSPVFGEQYLQANDHAITEKMRPVKLIRYADDMVLIDTNKWRLRKMRALIFEWAGRLRLRIKKDWQIFRIYNGKCGRKIDFAGKCFGIGFNTIRKRIALSVMRQSRRIQRRQQEGRLVSLKMASGFLSRCGCVRFSRSLGFSIKYIQPININNLKGVVRFESYRQLYST